MFQVIRIIDNKRIVLNGGLGDHIYAGEEFYIAEMVLF